MSAGLFRLKRLLEISETGDEPPDELVGLQVCFERFKSIFSLTSGNVTFASSGETMSLQELLSTEQQMGSTSARLTRLRRQLLKMTKQNIRIHKSVLLALLICVGPEGVGETIIGQSLERGLQDLLLVCASSSPEHQRWDAKRYVCAFMHVITQRCKHMLMCALCSVYCVQRFRSEYTIHRPLCHPAQYFCFLFSK